jgi:hypothetical protein
MKKAFKQALRQIVQGTVKIVAVIVLIMVGAALLHDFAPRKVVAMDALERAYQQMAKEPDALPALTTLRVAERACKIKLPQPIVMITDEFQRRQPEAFEVNLREAQQTFAGMNGTGMEYLACGLTKMMIDEFTRQHGL